MNTVPDSHRSLLEENQVVILGTSGPHGEPQVTALWFLFENDVISMTMYDSSQKIKDLQCDPRASAMFIDPQNPYRTIELRGSVTIASDPDYEMADKIGAKYHSNLRELDGADEARSVVTLQVEKVHAFG